MSELRVGINGLGRIGRALFKIIDQKSNIKVVSVNDIDPNIKNHAYLLNYDSIYGRTLNKIKADDNNLIYEDELISFSSKNKIDDVSWVDNSVDVVIDSSGIFQNVIDARKIISSKLKKVIITHSPKSGIDKTIIFGANEKTYKKDKHNIISSSICDANACAPVINLLEKEIGITDGFITTLHPWLGYQNLLDGNLKSVSSPGHFWTDFALGRSTMDSLIPKNTTLMPAIKKALPKFDKSVHAMSFRVPTAIVSASDMTLTLDKNVSENNIQELFLSLANEYPDVISLNNSSLVSIDFKGIDQSCIIDLRWLKIYNKRKVKLVIWYDNEWGYSQRIVDILKII